MKTKIVVSLLLLLLQGCTQEFDKTYGRSQVKESLPGAKSAEQMKAQPYVKYDEAYLGKRVDYSAKRQSLLAKNVTINSYEPADINTVLDVVLAQTGVSHRVNNLLPGGKNDDTVDLGNHSVSFNGTFEEFMRYISALYDVNTVLDENDILTVSAYGVYAIKLDYYGEDSKYEAKLELSNDGVEGGGMTGKSESKFESSFWDDVKDMAGKYVSSGLYSIFKDASTITMTSRPSEYNALNNVLKRYQGDNNRQFVVSYKIFTLDNNKMKEYGAGLNMSYVDGGSSVVIDSQGLMDMLGGGASVALGTDRAFSVDAKLNALYQLTGSKVLQSGSFVTRNNTPIPLNMTNSQYYVSGRTRTVNNDTGEEDIEVETSEIITGTSFIITPRIMTDGRVEVTSGFTKSQLNSIDTFDTVQLPNVTTTEMFNSAAIDAGSLLMVARYEAQTSSEDSQYQLLGYGDIKANGEVTIVMVVGIDYYRAPLNR
ncbi:type II and III secretion system protein [Scandinavium sp. V105_16]|uniref:Type II and III secretion system protein n=1 Tax=Scandinavium lactucae TaxID=3095028 RepID=A0AAJ2S9U4_9ENTR|nr:MULTISPECIES: type II and III secretion system protein [unclassified Scandinavium]MDX6019668.1 type II and III secretion system protein [Scandinavium sp. V105_16]MDX6032673.1 type II and III secretion system protein [Scandinavium sp. V105_12]